MGTLRRSEIGINGVPNQNSQNYISFLGEVLHAVTSSGELSSQPWKSLPRSANGRQETEKGCHSESGSGSEGLWFYDLQTWPTFFMTKFITVGTLVLTQSLIISVLVVAKLHASKSQKNRAPSRHEQLSPGE